ncbi:hypothetical protein L21SP2_0394 [Salinispira pacifica]|uniref:Uncharacterized protein n=1 Tax=Salinispira pacifica TaxID=1307761 RepID=V5WF72_9SPIO|nr:hypothetical protein L21SP2_0394 [Salinispira pacifica]
MVFKNLPYLSAADSGVNNSTTISGAVMSEKFRFTSFRAQ